MEVSYATMIAIGTLVQLLARDASRYQAALAEAVNESAEWKRIADELKAERNALRSTTIDTATGHLLDAFGSLANEPRHGATDDAYRDRIVTKIHTIKLERDALRAQLDTERERHKQTASILAQYAPKTVDAPRAHPVKVGEWVERTSGEYSPGTKIGAIAQVIGIDEDGDYEVSIDGTKRCWSPK